MLKKVADVIYKPLIVIFENYWSTQEMPEGWKNVIKKGGEVDPGSHRLVSMTLICGKILEKFIKQWLCKLFEKMNSLTSK